MRRFASAILFFSLTSPILANAASQSAFVSRSLPGIVNAYEYDRGGEGIAYRDTTAGNSGSASYRAYENVDVGLRGSSNYELRADPSEWVEFTVKVTETADYSFSISYSDQSSGTVTLSSGSSSITANLPSTGGNGTFRTVNFGSQLPLASGTRVLRLTVNSGSPYLRQLVSTASRDNQWMVSNFSNFKVKTGSYSSRQNVEAPIFVKDATGTAAKYSFAAVDKSAPYDNRIGYMNVNIKDLKSTDAWGAGISTNSSYPGAEVYISNVTIEPNWPTWVSYSKTNYDGMTLDSAAALYAENLTIKNWNADGAIDSKASVNQLVNLKVQGGGHRALRLWKKGPHYLVNSDINNETGGTLIWIKDCSTIVINVFNSKFAGSSTVPSSRVQCDSGSKPTINYLTRDPRTTGEMHAMFD